jgi:hypothetical protein
MSIKDACSESNRRRASSAAVTAALSRAVHRNLRGTALLVQTALPLMDSESEGGILKSRAVRLATYRRICFEQVRQGRSRLPKGTECAPTASETKDVRRAHTATRSASLAV